MFWTTLVHVSARSKSYYLFGKYYASRIAPWILAHIFLHLDLHFQKKTKRCGRVMNSSVDCGGNILGINMGVAGAIFCSSKSQDRAPEGGHRSDYTNLLRMFERLHSPPKTPLGRLQRRGTDETSINSRGLRPGSQELLGHKVCSQEFTMCSRSIITQLFVIFHFIGYYD